MVKTIFKGNNYPLQVSYVDITGEEKIPDTNPTVSILYYDESISDWDLVVTSLPLTRLGTTSTYYYEVSTSSLSTGSYLVKYSATADAIPTIITDEFILTEKLTTELSTLQTNILNQVKELRHGNESVEFTYTDTLLTSMTIKTKEDTAADWTSPTSTKTLNFVYAANKLVRVE